MEFVEDRGEVTGYSAENGDPRGIGADIKLFGDPITEPGEFFAIRLQTGCANSIAPRPLRPVWGRLENHYLSRLRSHRLSDVVRHVQHVDTTAMTRAQRKHERLDPSPAKCRAKSAMASAPAPRQL